MGGNRNANAPPRCELIPHTLSFPLIPKYHLPLKAQTTKLLQWHGDYSPPPPNISPLLLADFAKPRTPFFKYFPTNFTVDYFLPSFSAKGPFSGGGGIIGVPLYD